MVDKSSKVQCVEPGEKKKQYSMENENAAWENMQREG